MTSKQFSQASANLAALVDAHFDLKQSYKPNHDFCDKIVGLIGWELGVMRTCLDSTATPDVLLQRLPQLTSARNKMRELTLISHISLLDPIIRDVVTALDSRTKEGTAKDYRSNLSYSWPSGIVTPGSECDEPLVPAENFITATCAKVEHLVDRVEKPIITHQNPPQHHRNEVLASENENRMTAPSNEPKLPEAVQDSELQDILQRLLALDEKLQAGDIQCSEVQGLIALCIRWSGNKAR
ncbi:MAG: hypothetical protein Q9207_003618 [Kuettlingeria erythrocarpa]